MKKVLILGGLAALSVSLAACSSGDDATNAEASESAAADVGTTGDMGGVTATDPAMGTGTSGMGDTTGTTGGAAGTTGTGATTGAGTDAGTGAGAGATTGAAPGDGSTAGGAGTRP